MKLIFDIRVLTHKNYTGVENYTNNILQSISQKLDIALDIATAKPKTSNKYLSHLWTHFILPFKKGDILFCPANIAPLFVPKNKKLVVTIHDVAFLTYPKSFSKFFQTYYRLVMPLIVKRADKIITDSKTSKKEIIKFYPKAKEKIEIIYLGCDQKFVVLNNIKKKNQILYVGSMNERKNFSSIIKAFETLNNNNYTLLMVGNFLSNFIIDDETRELINAAKSNPNIKFKNGVNDDELVQIYNESKLLVFPSFYEGFGLPVLEAMACGTAVVCSDATSIPEVGGDAVVYCDPYNVEDIKDKIALVLADENLQKSMRQKGVLRAKEFTWEKSAREHMRVFDRMTRERYKSNYST